MKLLLICICFFTLDLFATPTVVGIFGGETCPWSKQLQEEIWSHPGFQRVLQEGDLKQEVRKASSQESETPVLILVSSEGEELGRVGYLLVPPEKYGQLFLEMLQIEKISRHLTGLNVDQLLTLYKKCQILNMYRCSEKILKVGLEQDPGVDFLVEQYIKICKDHPRKARKVKKEIRRRKPQTAHVEWQMAVAIFEAYQKAKPLEKYLRRFGDQDLDSRWKCHLILAESYKERSQTDRASYHLKEAIAEAPEELKTLIIPLEVR